MDRERAQRAIQSGPNHPDYDEAVRHAHAHYTGLLRGAERHQAMRRAGGMGGGASSSSHCALTALILVVMAMGWPVAFASWIGGAL